jgi:hypothetical protein
MDSSSPVHRLPGTAGCDRTMDPPRGPPRVKAFDRCRHRVQHRSPPHVARSPTDVVVQTGTELLIDRTEPLVQALSGTSSSPAMLGTSVFLGECAAEEVTAIEGALQEPIHKHGDLLLGSLEEPDHVTAFVDEAADRIQR